MTEEAIHARKTREECYARLLEDFWNLDVEYEHDLQEFLSQIKVVASIK